MANVNRMWGLGATRERTSRGATPTGRLTKKISLQAQYTIALPRRAGSWNASRMRARDGGVIIAAPMPCRTRPAMSAGRLGLNPHAIEATVKRIMPMP
jgi:hypothetical protein